MDGVHHDDGGVQALECFCNRTARGTGYRWWSGMAQCEPELVELGDRVLDEVIAVDTGEWSALLDAQYQEYMRMEEGKG